MLALIFSHNGQTKNLHRLAAVTPFWPRFEISAIAFVLLGYRLNASVLECSNVAIFIAGEAEDGTGQGQSRTLNDNRIVAKVGGDLGPRFVNSLTD